MTSPAFNARKAQAEAEMAAYDSLPRQLREVVDASEVRASVVLAAFLRGVPMIKIIETINKRSQNNASSK